MKAKNSELEKTLNSLFVQIEDACPKGAAYLLERAEKIIKINPRLKRKYEKDIQAYRNEYSKINC